MLPPWGGSVKRPNALAVLHFTDISTRDMPDRTYYFMSGLCTYTDAFVRDRHDTYDPGLSTAFTVRCLRASRTTSAFKQDRTENGRESCLVPVERMLDDICIGQVVMFCSTRCLRFATLSSVVTIPYYASTRTHTHLSTPTHVSRLVSHES